MNKNEIDEKEILRWYFNPYITVIFTAPLFLFLAYSVVVYGLSVIMWQIDVLLWNWVAWLFFGFWIVLFLGSIPFSITAACLVGIPVMWNGWHQNFLLKSVVVVLLVIVATILASIVWGLEESLLSWLSVTPRASSWLWALLYRW